MKEQVKYDTMDEAIDHQILCGTCGKPQRTLVGHYNWGKSYYTLDRCKKPYCKSHCNRTGACGPAHFI